MVERMLSACIRLLRPTSDELVDMALREATPQGGREFCPITRGPVVAVMGVIALMVVALPAMVWRLLSRALAR
jgi:hypothetical protein